ncbi:Protein preli-like [Strongyloides ratti]|uniref:Protein preli-like n=1 Tax=Strongyloides ratti TaxID=34506 RepID=A0A090L9I0_STRRB|nr:Protein preli-like [Strongyloides ratti]CEF66407.1 Protein preli-like [Strongyloides ratti]
MRFWHSPIYVFKYSFNDVTSTFWNRYPNDFAKHIMSEDILERRIEGNKIYTKKLIVKRGSSFLKYVPSWLCSLNSIKVMPVIEESIFDKDNKTLKTYTRNVAHRKNFMIEERCVYSPNKDDYKSSTDVKRSVVVDVDFGTISNIVQRFILIGFKRSVKNTILGFNQILAERNNKKTEKDNYFKDEVNLKIEKAKEKYKLLNNKDKQNFY